MSSFHEPLRSYQVSSDPTNIMLNEVSRNDKYIVYVLNRTDDVVFPLLKTMDVSIVQIKTSPWSMILSFSNNKDKVAIQRIDRFIASVVEHNSKSIFNEEFTVDELYDENVFTPSVSDSMTLSVNSLCNETYNLLSKPSLSVYEPNKQLTTSERLVTDVICRCAFRPWYVLVYPKTRRTRVLWIIEQCMIMEEPMNVDFILDPDDEEDT